MIEREREEDRGERADADAEDGDDADHDRIDARPATTAASDAVEAAARAVGARGGLKIGFPTAGGREGRGCAHLALLVELHGRAGHLVDLGGHGPGESLKRGLRLDAGHEARALARQLAERHARLNVAQLARISTPDPLRCSSCSWGDHRLQVTIGDNETYLRLYLHKKLVSTRANRVE